MLPSNVHVSRVGNTIQLSWDSNLLEDVKGFFIYRIKLTPDANSSHASRKFVSVPFNATSINITDTDPRKAYTVSISLSVLTEIGPITGPAVHVSVNG